MNNLLPKKNKKKGDYHLQLLLEFLDKHISNFWIHSAHYTNDAQDENVYSEVLYHYFLHLHSEHFSFTPQALQGDGRTVDLAVTRKGNEHFHVKIEYLFCLEAKFLPTNDYVTGKYAAIKRFKANQHGANNYFQQTPIKNGGIVAYVKSGSNSEHLSKINEKISDLHNAHALTPDSYGLLWASDELLTPKNLSQDDRYISKHLRIDNSEITLHHFWVKVV